MILNDQEKQDIRRAISHRIVLVWGRELVKSRGRNIPVALNKRRGGQDMRLALYDALYGAYVGGYTLVSEDHISKEL